MATRRRRNAALPSLSSSQYDSSMVNEDNQMVPPHPDHETIRTSCIERYKLVVLGDEECGKTALLNTLVKSSDFEIDDCSFTTFDECVTDVKTQQDNVEFTLYEITGMDDYSGFRLELYRGANVFLVCFDIGRPQTLQSVIKKWSPEIKHEYPNVPFLMIGCKNDLRTDSAILCTSHEEDTAESVSRIKAEFVSRKIGARAYVECCAKTRWNVERVFEAAAEAILQKEERNSDLQTKNHSVLRRFSKLTTERNTTNMKRGSIFSFVMGSNV